MPRGAGSEINKDTTIIVDEAGMLSTRQAHHILQLSERHGAKIVFAGDTQQQQPVEAGPGLRLIRDTVGSVRVDRIRRQKADLEDILTHVQGETPETARLLANSMEEERRTRILAYYENMKERLEFTPWQVAASEALRDGDVASAIAALHLRGRFHIGYDEEKTLTGLVYDWDRYQRANPDKSSVVLARTRAEVRALSHLMREHRFAALPDGERADRDRAHADQVTVTVNRGTEDHRATSPLEIARGDRLRIGATHWEKQLFNGTVVTVEDFKVERGEAGTAPSVLISARTEDGREVRFHHDEIRDWFRNIRLDHGYAMTITSAQGLTVDRTFLLADARPSRETIYPAATRHRERLDIYVNRASLALDIADRWADNDREAAVTDTEIRAYLAECWSRSQPKEAALDYMANGLWEERRENVAEDRVRSPGEARGEAGEVRAAANDNALARIARDIRRTTFGWRHAKTVAAFSKNMLLDRSVKSEIHDVLAQLDKVVSNRNYFDTWCDLMARKMNHLEALEVAAVERGVAIPDHEDYDTWRDVTDFAVSRCEGLMDDPGRYAIHPDYNALQGESLGSALARVRDVLEEDDRYLATTLAGQRKGEDIRMREERVTRLLDNPEKLRQLRQQRAERKAGQQQSKGRHMSMRI